jgi:hypothetical protein
LGRAPNTFVVSLRRLKGTMTCLLLFKILGLTRVKDHSALKSWHLDWIELVESKACGLNGASLGSNNVGCKTISFLDSFSAHFALLLQSLQNFLFSLLIKHILRGHHPTTV